MKTLIGTEKDIPMACELIKNGELVVFPTETVYGLGADAFNPQAVKKIFEAKQRPMDNPLIVHLVHFEDIFNVATQIPKLCYALYEKYCPGPLTMILKKSPSIPPEVTAGRDTVGVRFPSHPMAKALIEGSTAIAAPSANLAKHISPTCFEHAYEDLNGRVPLILDGGQCSVGIESTIIDLTSSTPTILRPGAITIEQLHSLCNAENYKGELGIALAPGMKYKHYSPRCECIMREYDLIFDEYSKAENSGKTPVVIARQQTIDALPEIASLSLGIDGNDAARLFYLRLHQAEEQYDYIIVEKLPETGVFYSVMNRAKKSTAKGS